jgi:hypothetical protein
VLVNCCGSSRHEVWGIIILGPTAMIVGGGTRVCQLSHVNSKCGGLGRLHKRQIDIHRYLGTYDDLGDQALTLILKGV